MPIGPLPPGCVAICAPEAEDATGDVSVAGACQLSTGGVVLSDVVVTGCTVEGVSFQIVTPRAIGVTVDVTVSFTFTGTIDGFTFRGQGTCSNAIFFTQVLAPTHSSLLAPPDCAANLTCTARSAGFDPTRSIQTFIVRLSGSVTCVICGGGFTIVQACPPPATAGTAADAAREG